VNFVLRDIAFKIWCLQIEKKEVKLNVTRIRRFFSWFRQFILLGADKGWVISFAWWFVLSSLTSKMCECCWIRHCSYTFFLWKVCVCWRLCFFRFFFFLFSASLPLREKTVKEQQTVRVGEIEQQSSDRKIEQKYSLETTILRKRQYQRRKDSIAFFCWSSTS